MSNVNRLDPRERILATLAEAEWEYDEEIDEMEISFPGGAGRAGMATLIGDEFYVRVDPDTFDPLSIIIPGYTAWLARQPQPSALGPTTDARHWLDSPRQTAREAILRTVRSSTELLAAS
jgi:hypothetical protein